MDDDVEIIVPDNLDDSDVGGIFPDFSHVQIQVHGSDVAEKIMEDIADATEHHEVFETEEYLDTELDDIQEISDDYPEHIQESETITECCKEDIITEETLTEDILTEDYEEHIQEESETITEDCKDNILLIKQHAVQEYTDITESDNYEEEELDDIERIPDKDISKYDAVIEEYLDYGNVSIKEEIEPFMGTDYTDFEAGPIEHNSDDLPPEDIYHCNNVIILGSKPCQSTSNGILRRLLNQRDSIEENEIKKENLNAVVLLEDWGANLERSQSFCKNCGTLFATPNELDAHNMAVHSFLVPVSKNMAFKSTTKPAFVRKSTGAIVVNNNKNIARKSTGSKAMGATFCNHCNKVFPDHNTLIKHLYELLPLKKFTCNICNAVFKTQKDLTNHNVVHVKPEKVRVKREKTDIKRPDLQKKLMHGVKKEHPVSQNIEFEAIPKSILFQCPKCGIHFVTAIAAFQHKVNCDPLKNKKKPTICDICKRKIQQKDLDIHKKQHKMCTKFRVFKVNKNLSEITLCKCPNCELHFSHFGMIIHLKDCGYIDSAHCPKCNILIRKSKFYRHMRMHRLQNLKPKDFINIQYSIQRCSVKRKLEPPKTPSKKIKLENSHKINNTKVKLQKNKMKTQSQTKITLNEKAVQNVTKEMLLKEGYKFRMYFCRNCKGCCFFKRHRIYHLNAECLLHTNVKSQVICPDCGLQFSRTTMKYHKNLHNSNPNENFTIHKVAFFDNHTLKRTVPLIPNYSKCADCKIHFFDSKVQADHICGEDYETCYKCGDKYHNSAYNVHIEFHKLIKTVKPTQRGTKLIPELMKKYKSLNMMWNIAYCCKNCDIVTDQYDKAVEHSQGHLNQKPMTKNIKCYICNLKFDETCWSKHSDHHSRMNINSKDFNILTYNPKKLLTEEWFELFQTLPTDQISQVTDKSVYGYERRFQMKLLKEGRSEFTVYCCSDCNVGCRNNEIEKHINGTCRSSTNICKVCSIPFSDISTLRNHQILHLRGIKKEEFRVVIFTKQQTKYKQVKQPIKHKLPKQEARRTLPKQPQLLTKRNKISNINTKKSGKKCYKGVEIDRSGKYILYRCNNCKSLFHFHHNTYLHDCNTSYRAVKCQHCNELVNRRHMNVHVKRHEERPDFNVNNFIIKVFDVCNKTNQSKDVIKPVKKKSKTMSYKKGKDPTKGNTSGTIKTRNAFKVEKVDSPKTDTSNVSSASKTAKVYKCECGLHYTSLKNIEKHIQTCDSDIEISKEPCSKCGLLFPTDVLVSHLCKHHSKNSKFTVELYQKEPYVESTSESPVPTKKTRFDCQVKLYKCNVCNVYFVNQNTCYKHVYKNHQPIDQRYCIECKLCGLQFTTKTLSVHVNRHHSNVLSLKNILVEEYYPGIGKVTPKIDLYVAADKVQSFQVTSSIEERLSDS